MKAWDLSCMTGKKIRAKLRFPGTICITEFSCKENKWVMLDANLAKE